MKRGEIENIEIDLLLEAIHRRCGYDFRSYARASVERRTRQFLSRSGCSTISDMIGRVLYDEDFLSRLVQYFSISVTEIFRDPFVYRALREEVVPLLLGHIVRFSRDRRHPDDLAAEAADVLRAVLSDDRPLTNVIDKILEDL